MGTPLPTSPHSPHSDPSSHSPQASESSLYLHNAQRDVSSKYYPLASLETQPEPWAASPEVPRSLTPRVAAQLCLRGQERQCRVSAIAAVSQPAKSL